MRPVFRWILAVLVLAGGLAGRADELPNAGRPPLLAAAFQAFLENQQRWAYTQTTSYPPADGSPAPESVVRTDPSQPYDQQSVPLVIKGQPPTEKQRLDWAKQSEKRAQRRLQAGEEAAAAAASDQGFRLRLINREVRLRLEAAKVVAEDEASVTYEIPLQELGGPDAALADDHQLTARVNRARRQFEHATIRQTKMVRIAAGKHYDGLTEIEFATPDPQYPSVPARLTSTSTNKPLFGPAHTSASRSERKDFKRVTPYDERFKVKLAPLNLLEF